MRFVLIRMGQRPLNMYLWYLWTLFFISLIYRFEANSGMPSSAMKYRLVMMISVLALIANVILLLRSISTSSGRSWLLTPMHVEPKEAPSLASCAIIRAVPLVVFIVFLERRFFG